MVKNYSITLWSLLRSPIGLSLRRGGGKGRDRGFLLAYFRWCWCSLLEAVKLAQLAIGEPGGCIFT